MHRSTVLAVSLLALAAAACGGASPEVQSPTTNIVPPPSAPVATTQAQAQVEQTPLVAPRADAPVQAKQGPATKDDEGGDGVARAIAQMEAETNAAQQAKDKAKWEKMGRDIERKATDADARDRLARASARVAQSQNQLSRVPAQRRGRYNTDMVSFGAKKADVQARISSIYSYGSDEWKRMRAELDKALDELDAAATRVEGDLF